MLRSSIAVPLFLSALVVPAAGESSSNPCLARSWSTPRCEAQRAREFAAARNAEIDRSIAAVEAERARRFTAARNAEIERSIAAVEAARGRDLALSLTHCKTGSPSTPRCKAERAREFAAARNAEIERSIAAVKAERARVLALSLTHCKTASATTPRCLAQRLHELATIRNAEIETGSTCQPYNWLTAGCEAASMGQLALSLTHCKTAGSTTPRCQAERAHRFAAARNAEIDASIKRVAQVRAFEQARNAEIDRSIAAVKAARARAFAAARNAEIELSVAAVTAERARVLALSLTHCKTASSTTPRCLAERANRFAQARNSEIDASIKRVAQLRSFEQARNAEIDRSIAAVKAERARQFARARNQEINASVALVEQNRASEFTRARNAEIDASVAAYEAQRVLRAARARMAMFDRPLVRRPMPSSQLETGAIGTSMPSMEHAPRKQQPGTIYAEPCGEARQAIEPLRFSAASTEIDDDMKPSLDRLALIAQSCPGVRIKIYGYSDMPAPVQVKRRLAVLRAQAARNYLINAGVAANRIAAIGQAMPRPATADALAGSQVDGGLVEFSISDLSIDASATRIMWELAEVLDPAYIPPLARLSP